MREIKSLLFLFLFIPLCSGFAQLELQQAFPSLTFTSPVEMQDAGDGTDRLFVVEQAGRIRVFENNQGTTTTKVFLDITDRVSSGGELGLLGLAFHPDYKNNGYFYVDYTVTGPVTRISRFKVSSSNPDSAVKNSELILLTQNQPYNNHKGGKVAFGPDGFLYIALGDGGSGGDPQNYAQNLTSLLGKILRVDVNNTQNNLNYAIPSDNPFVGNAMGYREEIFAYGLRNPWRFSFDPLTGVNWCADVGQGDYEEIDIIENGKNYGWRCYEGNHSFNLSGCNAPEYTFPIWEYDHSGSNCSATGGYLVRGIRRPELYGTYVYGDYCSGMIWQLTYNGTSNNQYLITAPSRILTFGDDMNNELYICCSNGKIYEFKPAINTPTDFSAIETSPGKVQLSWFDQSNNETGFYVQRKGSNNIFKTVGTVGSDLNSFIDNVPQPDEYTYRVYGFNNSAVSGYSNEAVININSVPVPVDLVTFTAEYLNNEIHLTWKTSTEKNNRGFEIERYLNGRWGVLTFIAGNGTTTQSNLYSYVDELRNINFNGILLYRLKQIDYDGKYTYSKEAAVKLLKPRNFILYQNYPNPFNPETKITWQSPIDSWTSIKIIDMLGNEVTTLLNEFVGSGNHEIVFNSRDITSGVYYVFLNAGSFTQARKITLLR